MSRPIDSAQPTGYPQDAQQTLAYPYLDDSLQPPAASPYAVPAPDERPKTLGKLSLGGAIAGTALSAGGFLPLPGLSLALAVLGGLLLLTAFILGIAALVKRTQGGKALGIGGIIASIIGGGVFIAALFVSLVVLGLSSAAAESEAAPDETVEEVAPPVEAGGYDEEAYLAQVRPQLNDLVTEIAPDAPAGLADSYPDDVLVGMGKALLVGGDFARDALAATLDEATGDLLTDEQAARFVGILATAAQAHLAE